MTINTHITAVRFQFIVKTFDQRVVHLEFIAADPADDMVMIVSGNFIH